MRPPPPPFSTRPGAVALAALLAWAAATSCSRPSRSTGHGGAETTTRPSSEPASPTATEPALEPIAADSLTAIRLVRAGHADSVSALLRGPQTEAREALDRRALARLLALECGALSAAQHAREALAPATEAIALGAALPDTLVLMRALRARAYASGLLGHFDDQMADAQRLIAVAERVADHRFHGLGLALLGYVDGRRGELVRARTHLEAAVRELGSVNDLRDESIANVALGSVYLSLGETDRARTTYLRNLAIARESHQPLAEAQTLNDLGVLEFQSGDPAAAAGYYRAAYDSHRSRDETADALVALSNLAKVEGRLGHDAAAESLLRLGFALADQRGLRSQRAALLTLAGATAAEAGRWQQAKRLARSVLAMGDTAGTSRRVSGLCSLAWSLASTDSAEAGIRLLRQALSTLTPHTSDAEHVRLLRMLALVLRGNPRASIATELSSIPISARAGLPDQELGAWVRVAVSHRELGEAAEARAACAHGVALWEQRRLRSTDPEWREVLASDYNALGQLAVELALEGPPEASPRQRIAAAYDVMQRFKSRSLLERMAGARAVTGRDSLAALPVHLAALRDSTLRPGELLLDAYVGVDRSWCFAVTRDSCAVFDLGATPELRSTIALAIELLSAAPPGPAAADSTTLRSLHDRLFGRMDQWIRPAHAILIAPDDALHLIPAAVVDPERGLRARSAAPAIWLVPSASTLAALRARRPRATAPGGATLLAVAGRDRDAPLGGATAEVGWLGHHFEHAVVRGLAATDDTLNSVSLAAYDVLHFAGHTVVDDVRPWRSVVPGVRDVDGTPLRAAGIAAMRLPARLAVLSSCRTASGRVREAEGVTGLSTAFIVAGVPSVVGTLWRVDDQVTARLMRVFYDELASGRSAAVALGTAQSTIRVERATAHPFYWAGFVLVGEGSTTVPLVRRAAMPVLPLAAAAIVALALIAGLTRRRGRPKG